MAEVASRQLTVFVPHGEHLTFEERFVAHDARVYWLVHLFCAAAEEAKRIVSRWFRSQILLIVDHQLSSV